MGRCRWVREGLAKQSLNAVCGGSSSLSTGCGEGWGTFAFEILPCRGGSGRRARRRPLAPTWALHGPHVGAASPEPEPSQPLAHPLARLLAQPGGPAARPRALPSRRPHDHTHPPPHLTATRHLPARRRHRAPAVRHRCRGRRQGGASTAGAHQPQGPDRRQHSRRPRRLCLPHPRRPRPRRPIHLQRRSAARHPANCASRAWRRLPTQLRVPWLPTRPPWLRRARRPTVTRPHIASRRHCHRRRQASLCDTRDARHPREPHPSRQRGPRPPHRPLAAPRLATRARSACCCEAYRARGGRADGCCRRRGGKGPGAEGGRRRCRGRRRAE